LEAFDRIGLLSHVGRRRRKYKKKKKNKLYMSYSKEYVR
jgi:hypothetical protein